MKITKTYLILLLGSIFLYSLNAQADGDLSLSLGVKLLGANWSGHNQNSDTDFSAGGTQFGLNAALQKGRFYTGLNLQSGEYTFDDNAPDQVSKSGSQSYSNVKIKHSEVDLIAGYFFWKHISLFLDIKGFGNQWDNNDYKLGFSGIGLGASGMWPLSKRWSLYGSFGFVPSGKLEANNEKIGSGSSAAIEFGSIFSFNASNRLTLGLKQQSRTYKFDSGDQQEHKMNGIFLGYSHLFLY